MAISRWIDAWRKLSFVAVLCCSPVHAEEFRLAMSSSPTSMDPHFFNLYANLNVHDHLFEALVKLDADSRVKPGLAESWRSLNKLTWEFKLRQGVKFHDGSELTSEDVAWSLDRPATIVGSPGKFDVYTKAIVDKKIIDKRTIQLTTREPYPLLLADLSQVLIVSKQATQGVSSDAFAGGKGLIGTGPYQFAKFLRDDRIELVRHDDYWGGKSAWEKVTLRFIPNGTARLAALLAGDVQAIENVPTPDLARVRNDRSLNFLSKVSHRVVYLYVDTVRDKSPYVTDKNGQPLDRNPLKDVRVRRALSLAIDREAIKSRVMEGLSVPTNNLVPSMMFGHVPELKTVNADPAAARKLLQEAGWANGFGLTLHTPNNRYVNDERIAQAIAQMWSRIGIVTKVEGMPMATYSSRGAKGDYSAGLLGWGAQTGEVSSPLRALVACPSPERGLGGFNWLKYCNPAIDKMLMQALNEMDSAERLKLLKQATEMAINDGALIPIHHQITTWASKKGYTYPGRTDERSYAFEFSRQ